MFDLRDVNYLRYSQSFRYPSKKVKGVTVKKGLIYGLCNFFVSFILSFFNNPVSWHSLLKKTKKNVVFYNGKTQYNALITLYNVFIARGEEAVMINWSDIPMCKSYIYAIARSCSFWKDYFKSSKDDRKIMANELATFWRSYGDYVLIKKWLTRSGVIRMIVANDHVPLMRACLEACNEIDVTSVYIQHASVTDKFPPLISTYSFLDGQDSFEKYKKDKTVSSRIFVIGGARFDLVDSTLETTDVPNSIGIALTLRDEQSCWERLVDSLLLYFPQKMIVLRPHPRMEKESIKRFCNTKGILYSDPIKENIFSFLKKIGMLVANETSTHLDAMIMHRPTILYIGLSSLGLRDHYGMVKSGLLNYCSCFEELKSAIYDPQKLFPDVDKVRYYNASYMTKYEFKVSELVANILIDDDVEGLVDVEGINYIEYDS